jgi:serine/threonine protein kinase
MQDFYRRYKVSWRHPLGEGAFGKVYPATHRGTRELVALKKIPKKYTDTNSFQNEMDALLQIRSNGGHPYICSLRENFEDSQHYYLILDLVSGGEMFDHLIRMGAYSEADAARLVSEVANALTFLHGMGVVHGDLKPENLMLSTDRSEDAVIQLVDFGCAQVAQEEGAAGGGGNGGAERGDNRVVSERRWSGGNTPAYCPPEVLEKKRDPLTPSVDVWSLGVIMFIMLTGLHPFDLNANATDAEIEHCIKTRQAPPLRNSPITAHLSPSAIDVIEKCLQWDSKDRITASELLEHPWVRGETAREDKMQDSVKRLSMFRVFKSKLEAKVFADFFSWSDDGDSVARKASLMERAFHTFDSTNKGFLTKNDLNRTLSSGRNEKNMFADKLDDATKGNADGGNTDNPLSLSGFSDLLAENMKNRYFPRGHVVCKFNSTPENINIGKHRHNSCFPLPFCKLVKRLQDNEGDIGNHM